MNQYGIDIKTLRNFIGKPSPKKTEWGVYLKPDLPAPYALERLGVDASKILSLVVPQDKEATIFIEEGSVLINNIELKAQEIISVGPLTKINLEARAKSIIYLFYGTPSKTQQNDYFKKTKTFDNREKYWGKIETIVSKEYAGKRILIRKNQNSSLEFHCRKIESYFIHSGNLLIRLRAGRGEDRFFELGAGQTAFMPPGLVHQRGGLEDTIIIEISTKDEDADSFLVEDGQKHKMPNLT